MFPVALALEWVLFTLASLLGMTAWFVYLWAVRDGQFRDVESAAEKVVGQEARD